MKPWLGFSAGQRGPRDAMRVPGPVVELKALLLGLIFALSFRVVAGTPAFPSTGWPTYQEQLTADCIDAGSPLALFVANNQEFWMLREDEKSDGLSIPPWLRVAFRKAHPEPDFVFTAQDPTRGYPLFLKDAAQRLSANQYFVTLDSGEEARAEASAHQTPVPEASVGTNTSTSGLQSFTLNESYIQVNYFNPSLILGAANESAVSQRQLYSTDGGATWNGVDLPIVLTDAYHSDPWVGWTSDGTAWACTMGIKGAKAYIRFYHSTNNGATWTYDSTISGSQSGVDKEMGWVDLSSCSPYADSTYFIWHNGNPAYVNHKPKGGSWGTPTQLSGSESTGTCIGADIKTNAYGDVFAFWPTTGNSKMVTCKSTDGGAHWVTPVIVTTTYDNYDIGVPAQDVRRVLVYAVGGAYRTPTKNNAYLAWNDLSGETGCTAPANEPGANTTSTCKTRIWFSRSLDGGATWSAPAMINNQASLNDQFYPWLAVDETTGALGIVYNDTLADAGRLKTDIWYQASYDDGATWTAAQKVTTAMTDETGSGAYTSMQYGDYNGLSGFAGLFFPSWIDRRDSLKEETWTARVTDCVPPAAPAAPTFSSIGCNSLAVNWPSSSGATLYDVYRIAGGCSGTSPLLVGSGISGTSFNDSGLTPASPYAYYIVVRNSTCQRYACGVCSTATTSAAPLRVPYSLTATKITTGNHGIDGTVTWDVGHCASTGYHLIYGNGDSIATLDTASPTVGGVMCHIGATDSYPWSGIPDPSSYTSRYLWFLIVGDDGASTEGSWGLTSASNEEGRGTASANGCCTTKNTSGSCGTP